MMGLGERGAGGGGAGVVGAEGISGSGVSAMTSVRPGVLQAVNSSRCSWRSLANLSRQASVCFELLPRQALQPGVSPNFMMPWTLDPWVLAAGLSWIRRERNLTEGRVRQRASRSTLKSRNHLPKTYGLHSQQGRQEDLPQSRAQARARQRR